MTRRFKSREKSGDNVHFSDTLDRTDNNQPVSSAVMTDFSTLWVDDGQTEIAPGKCATLLLIYHSCIQGREYLLFLLRD